MLGLTTTVARASSRKSSKAHEVITERMFEVCRRGLRSFSNLCVEFMDKDDYFLNIAHWLKLEYFNT